MNELLKYGVELLVKVFFIFISLFLHCPILECFLSPELYIQEPSYIDKWSRSNNLLLNFSYDIVDGFGLMLQAPFSGPTSVHLTGEPAVGDDMINGYVSTVTTVLPFLRPLRVAGTATKGGANIAKTPVGRSGNVLNVVTKNTPTIINGTKFTGHALDQMQARGIISPSAVLDVVKNPAKMFSGNTPGTTVFVRDNLKVITNNFGDIITVIPQ